MWTRIAHFIIKNRLPLVIAIGLITIFMGYHARKVEMRYDFAQIVPESDPDAQYLTQFRKTFGEDGNMLVIGVKDSAIYQTTNFKRFKFLSDELAKLEGVNNVLSLPGLQRLKKDTDQKRFVLDPLFPGIIEDQVELDSLLDLATKQRFYAGQIVNLENGATLILVSISKEILNSEKRMQLMDDIKLLGDEFSKSTKIELHYAGLPFVRTVMAGKVRNELSMFLMLSVAVTAVILIIFFRTWVAVVFPMIIIGVVVIWSMGLLVLLGFKVTILSGLIPPIIVVIGIPNSIYLINRYHQEYVKSGNQVKAISNVTRRIGLVAFMTNLTTSIGFLVLAGTDIVILREFGIVAGINILATCVVSMILMPSVFSWLPAPTTQQVKHLYNKPLEGILKKIDFLVHNHRRWVYVVAIVATIIGAYGLTKIRTISYVVDDIPEESQIKKDLHFFEKNFSGVMPLEVVVDTGKPKGVLKLSNLRKIEELEIFLDEQPEISKPVSIVSFVKAARQGYYNQNPAYYQLPNSMDYNFILNYFRGQNDQAKLIRTFVDSTGQTMRISLKIADIGSIKLDSLINGKIKPKIDSVFAGTDIKATVTGTSPLFVKGNQYLVANLKESILLSIVLIAVAMGILFFNLRIVIISLIPSFIPMIITAGLMGFFDVPLKPSTSLIFCIVFGIAVDNAINYLARYRIELMASDYLVPKAVTKSIIETGASMVYTSIILFFGFVIFAFSDFGGTVVLGVLTSITLLIAMVTNLIVLPSLLLTFDNGKRTKGAHPPVEMYEEFYHAEDDEEIDVNKLEVAKTEEK